MFDWDAHFSARVRMAGGDPDEKMSNGLPRYSMSQSGQIFDHAEKNEHGWFKMILDSFAKIQTIFQ